MAPLSASDDPLELAPAQMRAQGYQAVDSLVDRIERLDQVPVWTGATREEVDALLAEAPPEDPRDLAELVDFLSSEVLPLSSQNDHPRFFAYVPACPTWPSVLGDLLTSGANPFAGMWFCGAGVAGVEMVVLDWFKSWIGFPEESEGLLVSGGSMANLTALACARFAQLDDETADGVAYCTTQVHSSVGRALRVLGFFPDQLRTIELDAGQRMSPSALAAAIAEDKSAGRRPFAVVASAGTTNSGAVDPLDAVADICAEAALWMHVDGAYGGFSALTERGKAKLRGIERADSVTLDPHKWLFQPYAAGCVLVRRPDVMEQAFAFEADYHQDFHSTNGEVDFSHRGIELTRPARALKIWLSLKTFGVAAFREAIDRGLDLALHAEKFIADSDAFEPVTEASLGVVCFRRTLSGESEEAVERFNVDLVDRLTRDGTALISSTRIDGRFALRLCALNHRSTEADIERMLRWLEDAQPVADDSR